MVGFLLLFRNVLQILFVVADWRHASSPTVGSSVAGVRRFPLFSLVVVAAAAVLLTSSLALFGVRRVIGAAGKVAFETRVGKVRVLEPGRLATVALLGRADLT